MNALFLGEDPVAYEKEEGLRRANAKGFEEEQEFSAYSEDFTDWQNNFTAWSLNRSVSEMKRYFNNQSWTKQSFIDSKNDVDRRLSPRALAAKRRLEVPYINPLSLRAPQQCMSGTYCNERAASAAGTGPCPKGKFC